MDEKTNNLNLSIAKHTEILKNSHNNTTDNLNFNNKNNNIILIMKEASNEFVENYLSKVQDFTNSTEALIFYLKKNNINISDYQNKFLSQEKNESNISLQNKASSIVSKSYYGYKTVSQVAEEFIKAGKDSAIVGGVAAGAAAGFWIASYWSFGAMVPWAIAATNASASYFAQGAVFGISGEILKANPSWILAQTMDVLKNTYSVYGTFKLIQKIRDAVDAARILRRVQFATVWAVPIVNIVAFSLETILNNYANY